MMEKNKAKAEMLKHLSKEMSNDANAGLKDVLGKKKGMKKVTVASDSPEGLKKGLSMAEKLMELKSGKKEESPMEDMMEDASEEEEEVPLASENESSPSEEAEMKASEMSNEEAQAMYEALKKRCE